MNCASYKTAFDRDGFVLVRGFLDGNDFAELNNNLDRYIREVVPTLPDNAAFYHERGRPETLKQLQHMSDSYFHEYCSNSRWVALAAALLGEPVEPQGPEWFNKPAGTEHVTPPHQDNYYFCLVPSQVVTIWVALDKVDEENGCLRYVTGSHKHGLRPHSLSGVLGFSQGITDYSSTDRDAETVVRMEPGDLVCHHGETIHRADANRSATRERRAFATVMNGQSAQPDPVRLEAYKASLKAQHQSLGMKT